MRKPALMLLMALPMLAQSFEVASVRPLGPVERALKTYRCDTASGRFTNAGPMRQVILWAFDMKPYQLVGMPDWDPTVMYDDSGLYLIDARADGPVSEPVCKQMVQKLLADRFKLAVRREQKETPVFALVMAKNGPRMKLATDEDKVGNKIVINGKPTLNPPGAPGWSMDRLAGFLSGLDGRPWLNRTGLEGLYRINLDFSITPTNPDVQLPPEAGPDIGTALEQQMGLRLEATKAPITMLIIDRMEKPDAN